AGFGAWSRNAAARSRTALISSVSMIPASHSASAFRHISQADASSAVEAEDNQSVEEPERRGGDHKHVDRRNLVQAVAQKTPPGRGGDFGTPRHPPPNRGLA